MSLVPRCVVCDAKVHPYAPEALCERCQLPCPTCGGNVQRCQHPLRADLEAKELPNGRWLVAA